MFRASFSALSSRRRRRRRPVIGEMKRRWFSLILLVFVISPFRVAFEPAGVVRMRQSYHLAHVRRRAAHTCHLFGLDFSAIFSIHTKLFPSILNQFIYVFNFIVSSKGSPSPSRLFDEPSNKKKGREVVTSRPPLYR